MHVLPTEERFKSLTAKQIEWLYYNITADYKREMDAVTGENSFGEEFDLGSNEEGAISLFDSLVKATANG
jgi:hypothetical protein